MAITSEKSFTLTNNVSRLMSISFRIWAKISTLFTQSLIVFDFNYIKYFCRQVLNNVQIVKPSRPNELRYNRNYSKVCFSSRITVSVLAIRFFKTCWHVWTFRIQYRNILFKMRCVHVKTVSTHELRQRKICSG